MLGARTDVGRVRKNNEDNYCALLAPNTPRGVGGVLAVADGVGGHQAGERASQMAVEGVTRLLGKNSASAGRGASDEQREKQLREAAVKINGDVFAAANTASSRGMGTTLSMAVVEGETVSIGHVGDSRVYLQRNGTLTQLTPDHSWVAEEVARGAITPEEATRHPRRNLLTRAVGTQSAVEPTTLSVSLERGDTLLLCSDGLHGLVKDHRIAAVLSSKEPDEAAKVLVDMAISAGGTDNVTVIVAKVVSVDPLPNELWDDPNVATVTAEGAAGSAVPAGGSAALFGRLARRISRGIGRLGQR